MWIILFNFNLILHILKLHFEMFFLFFFKFFLNLRISILFFFKFFFILLILNLIFFLNFFDNKFLNFNLKDNNEFTFFFELTTCFKYFIKYLSNF